MFKYLECLTLATLLAATPALADTYQSGFRQYSFDEASMLGHSPCGRTVMSMAGACYNRSLISHACTIKPELRVCRYSVDEKTTIEQEFKRHDCTERR